MKDDEKTKEELMSELTAVRGQLDKCRENEAGFSMAKKVLSKTLETFRALFEQASDSIFLLEAGDGGELVIADANIAACGMHGYRKEELIGRPIRMLDTPETAKHIAERAERLMKREKMLFQGEHIRKDGTIFPVEISAQMISAGGRKFILAIDRDITERRNAEAAIKRERDRAQLFFEFAGVLLVVIDSDEKVSMINRRGCEILGYTKDEIIGKNWFDHFIPLRIRDDVRRTFRMLMAGKIAPVEYFENPIVNRNGDERIIAWHNTLIRNEHGDVVSTLSSGDDITGRSP